MSSSLTLGRRVAIFIAVFLVLTALYAAAAGSAVERFVIEQATVRPAAWLLSWLAPDVQAVALGSRLTAPGGGVNVLNGCEGADVFFLVLAGLAAAPLSWRHRALGLMLGMVLIFAANQARVIGLFFAARETPQWFALMHGVFAPLAMVLLVVAGFAWFMRRHAQSAVALYRL
jgi:exosortase/archaeosortase family protein